MYYIYIMLFVIINITSSYTPLNLIERVYYIYIYISGDIPHITF